MTATLLIPDIDVRPTEPEVRQRGTVVRRPPTLFGQESPWELVVAGHAAARRAIGLALEDVPLDEAVATLAQAFGPDQLCMAHDLLGWTSFDVPLHHQVEAFFLVEHARSVEARPARRPRLGSALERAASWLRRVRDRVRDGVSGGVGLGDPSGLRPAI